MPHAGHKLATVVSATWPVVLPIALRSVALVISDIHVFISENLQSFTVLLQRLLIEITDENVTASFENYQSLAVHYQIIIC